MSQTRIRRVLGAAAVVTAVVAAAPIQAQQGGQQQRPRAERMQQMQNMRQQTPEQRLDQRVGVMTERLALSADQATRVRAILQREHEQRTALLAKAGMEPAQGRMMGMRADSARPRQAPTDAERAARQAQMKQRQAQMEQVRGEMQQLQEQTDAQLKQVLSAEQQEKYRSLRPAGPRGEGQPGMMRNGGRPGMKGMQPGRMGGGMGMGMRGGRGA